MAARLGKRVRELRIARGLSLRALGAHVGVTPQSVWDWEKGRSQVPSEDLPELAAALGVTICQLYGIDEGHQLHSETPAERWARRLGEEIGAMSEADQELVRDLAETALRYRDRLRTEEGLPAGR